MLFRQHQTGDYKTPDSFDRVGDSNDCSLGTAVCCRETAGWRRKQQSRRQGDDTPPSSFTEFFREFLTPLGYRISPIRIPLLILLIIAYIFEFISICLYWVEIDYASTWNRGSIKLVHTSHSIRWERARAMLRYRPLYAFGTALARSMPYYRTRWARR